jgi:hypothetical protein
MTTLNAPFPNAVEQAAALLDQCGGDLDQARDLAALSVDCSRNRQELKWWLAVAVALTEGRWIN